MDRAGKQATPLTPDETRTIFELASSGRGQEETQQRLAVRNRTTIKRAYNVAVEFELRETTGLDDTTADQIAKAARYGATVTRVKDLFVQWRMWKSRIDPMNLTHVRAEAALNHVGKLGKVAEEFEAQLSLPRPYEAGSWIPPQGMRDGIVAISTGSQHVGIRPHYAWKSQEAGPGLLSLAVEEDLYFACLRDHLSDDSAWRSFDQWKTKGAAYLYACRQLVQAIVGECERRTTGSSILISREWPREGIFWYFARQVYVHHTGLAEGIGGVEKLGYTDDEQCSLSPGQGTVRALRHGGLPIACHGHWSVLEQWKSKYEDMLQGNDWTAQAKDLVGRDENLKEMARPIREVLWKEMERGTFDGGRCELCP